MSTARKRRILTDLIRHANHVDEQKPWIVAPAVLLAVRNYDPQLLIYWDRQGERYCIARRGEMSGDLHFIAVWQEDDGAYLPLDMRLLDALRAWDMRPAILDAPKNADELARTMDNSDEIAAMKQDATFSDDMDHLTRANKRQLTKALEEVH